MFTVVAASGRFGVLWDRFDHRTTYLVLRQRLLFAFAAIDQARKLLPQCGEEVSHVVMNFLGMKGSRVFVLERFLQRPLNPIRISMDLLS